ncbi:MAG: NblA/ycf18 family protein [Synechococcus sp.]
MDFSNKLTIEQQFRLQVYSQEVQNLSHELLEQYLIELLRHMMLKDNAIKQILKGQFVGNSRKQGFDA